MCMSLRVSINDFSYSCPCLCMTKIGFEPYYMLTFAQYFLSTTREECCEKFYYWDYYDCTGTSPPRSGDYYPDWSKVSSYTCLNDEKMPKYMLTNGNQRWYLSKTLKECCEKHFEWDVIKCMGIENEGTGKWYAKYTAGVCAQDCVGSSPCGGIAVSWNELYANKKACCEANFWYDTKCIRK